MPQRLLARVSRQVLASWWQRGLLALAGIWLTAPMAAGTAPEPQPSLLLITVDTLRRDHLSIYGYARPTSPKIDAFFADGEIYERAYATETNTPPSVISVLTGRYPPGHGVRLFLQKIEPDVETLADVLGRHEFRTAAVVSNSVLAGESIGLDERFDHYDDRVTRREGLRPVWERRAAATTDAALAWFKEARQSGKPFFLWVHYNDPHGPYDPPTNKPRDFSHTGEKIVPRNKIPAYLQASTQSLDALEYVDRYDEEIAYLDEELGRLLATIDHDDRPIVVVFTADHGETMIEHEMYFSHGFHVWESLVRVPLLVRRPGGTPRRINAPVSLVDLAPSVLQYLGIEGLPSPDGFPFGKRPAQEPILMEAKRKKSLLRASLLGNHKWFVEIDEERRVVERSFVSLGNEEETWRAGRWQPGRPGEELVESARTDPDPGGVPEKYRKGSQLEGPKVAPARAPHQKEALRALGYLE